MTRRLLAELRRRPSPAEVEGALASLRIRVEQNIAVISRDEGLPLFGADPERVERARLEPGVYTRIPTSEARVRLLIAVASIARELCVHVPAISDGTHRGRLAIDVPRRLVRAFGGPAAEPGDRFDGQFAHAFFDDEAIIDEAARAGLRFAARRGPWVELEHHAIGEGNLERAAPFLHEVVRVVGLIHRAEQLRRSESPEHAVRIMRERGSGASRRGHIGRARLRRAVGWVDVAYPGKGSNCFRRVLVEVGLDAGAAGETLVFGLDVGQTGHVAFKDAEDRRFDVVFEVLPDPHRK